MTKTQEMILNLEGFKYTMSLDLNMGYYHIRLITNVSNICTIIFVAHCVTIHIETRISSL